MSIPKPSTLHFLALSLALNIVLLGLVAHFVTTAEPVSTVAVAEKPSPALSRPVATYEAPHTVSEPATPIAPATSSASVATPLPAAPVYAPTYAAPAPVAQASWTPSPTASAPASPSAAANSNTYSPDTPGNSFRFRDMTVAIEGESPAEGGGASGLLLSLSGGGGTSTGTLSSSQSGGGSTTESAPTNVAANNQSNQNSNSQAAATPSSNTTPDSADPAATPGRSRSGFTYEEELFRTKWGWQAFNDAQAAAARAAATATPAN